MNLLSVMDDILHEFDTCNCTMFTNENIINAIKKLALGKSCGIDGLPGEAIKYCHPSIISKLQILFSSCCKHAYVPDNFCSGKITRVPKKNGVCSKFEDFRPVTTVNVLGKLFEYCILSKIESCLNFHELQFSFTPGGGCDKAVFGLRSVVEYFIEYGSIQYMCLP
jgi:hypothetical protein